LVSERLKNVFEAVDPEGFAFVECDYTLADGSKGPSYFLCDVVRTLDALDEENSKLNIEISDEFAKGKFYDFSGGVSLAFRKEIIGNSHAFRMPYSRKYVICDRMLHDAVQAAGMSVGRKSNGLWFEDAVDY
jgi:Protein of unknown function (DUF1629)